MDKRIMCAIALYSLISGEMAAQTEAARLNVVYILADDMEIYLLIILSRKFIHLCSTHWLLRG